jgi:hypothetical protein
MTGRTDGIANLVLADKRIPRKRTNWLAGIWAQLLRELKAAAR